LVHVDVDTTCGVFQRFCLCGVFGLQDGDASFALTGREGGLGITIGLHFYRLRLGETGVLDVVQVEQVDDFRPLGHQDVSLGQLYGRRGFIRGNHRTLQGDGLVVVMAHPVGTGEVALHGVSCPTQIIHPYAVLVHGLESQFHRFPAILRRTYVFVGLGDNLLQSFLVLRQDAGTGDERFYGGLHALFVRLVDVVFDEQSQTVARCRIAFRVARVEDVDQDAAFRSIVLAERSVEEEREAHFLHAFVELLFIHIERPLAQSFFHDGTSILNRISHHVLEIGTVRHVYIDEKFRHPTVIELQPSTHFGCIGLQEVTIEVDELGGVSGAQFFGSVLVDAVGGPEIFVSVHIEHGNEEEAHIVQDVDVLLFHHHVAEENHAGILPVGFTRMDARFNQDNHTSLLTDLHGVL